MLKPTLAQIKAAEAEMNERLASIPLALSNPYGRALALEKELSALEKTIKRLKAFVEFLRKLNPVQYIKWMQHAFAGYVPSKQTAKAAPTSATVAPTTATPSATVTPTALPSPASRSIKA